MSAPTAVEIEAAALLVTLAAAALVATVAVVDVLAFLGCSPGPWCSPCWCASSASGQVSTSGGGGRAANACTRGLSAAGWPATLTLARKEPPRAVGAAFVVRDGRRVSRSLRYPEA